MHIPVSLYSAYIVHINSLVLVWLPTLEPSNANYRLYTLGPLCLWQCYYGLCFYWCPFVMVHSHLVPFLSLFWYICLCLFLCVNTSGGLCYKSVSQDSSIRGGEKGGESHTDIWLLINSELAAKVYIRSPFVVDYVIFTM